jgi:hypothetical protein
MTVFCLTTLVAVAKQAESSRMTLQRFESSWIKSLVFKWQNLIVYECMEYRRSEECEPYFDLSLFGEDWQGQVYDRFSSDFRGVSEESFTSTENGTSLSAHGAQVAPSGRPLGGANL